MKDDNLYENAKEHLLKLAQEFDRLQINVDGQPPTTEHTIATTAFFNQLDQYIQLGLTRGDVYNILIFLYDHITYSDELYEYETALTGYCSYLCITKFPDEPSHYKNGTKELYDYIHSNKWKK